MATGGSKQNTKLFVALGLLVVAGIILFLTMRGGSSEPARPKVSDAERQAAQAEHDRQVKAAEAARQTPKGPPAVTGGSN